MLINNWFLIYRFLINIFISNNILIIKRLNRSVKLFKLRLKIENI